MPKGNVLLIILFCNKLWQLYLKNTIINKNISSFFSYVKKNIYIYIDHL